MQITVTKRDTIIALSCLTVGLGIGKFGCDSERSALNDEIAFRSNPVPNRQMQDTEAPLEGATYAGQVQQQLAQGTLQLQTVNNAILEEQAARLKTIPGNTLSTTELIAGAQRFSAAVGAAFKPNTNYSATEVFDAFKQAFDATVGTAQYNSGATNVAYLFATNADGSTRYQCESGSRVFMISARSVLAPELAKKLMYVHLEGHVLPALELGSGRYVAAESTVNGGVFSFSTAALGTNVAAIIVDAAFEDVIRSTDFPVHQRGLGVRFCSVPGAATNLFAKAAGPGQPSPFAFGEAQVTPGDFERGNVQISALAEYQRGARTPAAAFLEANDPKKITLKERAMNIVIARTADPEDRAEELRLRATGVKNVGVMIRYYDTRLEELALSDAELSTVGAYVFDGRGIEDRYLNQLFSSTSELSRKTVLQAWTTELQQNQLFERRRTALKILEAHGWKHGFLNDPLGLVEEPKP